MSSNPNTNFSSLQRGRPYPLGATPDQHGVNFAVFSANADRILLCLFDEGGTETARLPMPDCIDEVWCGYLPEAQPGLRYGYRAEGRYEPKAGHRFNVNKLLTDPYAKQLVGDVKHGPELYGYRLNAARADLSFNDADSAALMPKCLVTNDHYDWQGVKKPDVPWSETVIYEAHVRGISMRRDGIEDSKRGTFAALADPRFIDHLKQLGVTAVELLPIHAFLDEPFLEEKGLSNYWGYNTLGFFAPHPAYLSSGDPNEMRDAVKALHAAGLEVILDVVYNHSCEGNERGATMSFRGLDNSSYYRLIPGQERYYVSDSGCGNTMNLPHPRVLQMVMDSLRWWATAYQIDGFRFDLCSTLGREPTGFDPNGGFFDAIRQDPVLSEVKLIAEPWDIGPGGYQLGHHPPGFAEWNDKYRDSVRKYWRGDSHQRPELADRLLGSSATFNHRRRKPWASVNFISAHDGFTLHDVVTYNGKHNDANAENNRDGSDSNWSNNWGTEGPSDDEGINETRERVKRSQLTTLVFSQGTPMLLGGDEFGRTQDGNNNAFCQDNELSWLDWSLLDTPAGSSLYAFTSRLLELRKGMPILHSLDFPTGEEIPDAGVRDIEWFNTEGDPLMPDEWDDAEGRCLALRRAKVGPDNTMLVLLLCNSSNQDESFKLPPPALGWHLLIDSAEATTEVRPITEDALLVRAHSVSLLSAQTGGPAGEAPAEAEAA
ncbi:glycogen debranching protein GlgX [Nevskia ramosa]|uniref:glycogen debranching protein GlgX n=1 Tax=Nevskia ramosa TaxID=64002 RepID=UPI003D0E810A